MSAALKVHNRSALLLAASLMSIAAPVSRADVWTYENSFSQFVGYTPGELNVPIALNLQGVGLPDPGVRITGASDPFVRSSVLTNQPAKFWMTLTGSTGGTPPTGQTARADVDILIETTGGAVFMELIRLWDGERLGGELDPSMGGVQRVHRRAGCGCGWRLFDIGGRVGPGQPSGADCLDAQPAVRVARRRAD